MSKEAALNLKEFPVPPDSELAEEHALIGQFIEQVFANAKRAHYEIDVKNVPAGEQILAAKHAAARGIVLAAVEQNRHWQEMMHRLRRQAKSESERLNEHLLPGYDRLWCSQGATAAIVKSLTRRKLPFERSDLLDLMAWCIAADSVMIYWCSLGSVVKAVERYAEENEFDEEFTATMHALAERLRYNHNRQFKRFAIGIEQLIAAEADLAEDDDEPPQAAKPTPTPSAAGSPAVLTQLKEYFRLPSVAEPVETTEIGLDGFPLRLDSPLIEEHRLWSVVLEEARGTRDYYNPPLQKLNHGKQLVEISDDRVAALFLAAAERGIVAQLTPEPDYNDQTTYQARRAALDSADLVRTEGISWSRNETFDALLYLSSQRPESTNMSNDAIRELIDSAEKYAGEQELTEGERYALHLFRRSLVTWPAWGVVPPEVQRLTELIGDGATFYLTPGEFWSDRVNQEYSQWSSRRRAFWNALLKHLLTATSSRPSKKWLREAGELLKPIGEETFVECLERWLPAVTQGRSVRQLGYYLGDTRGAADTMQDENATILRGLLWIIPTLKARDKLARLVSEVTLSAYKKVPGVGPRAVRVGNAGVYVLSELSTIDAVGQLAVLKVRVKFGTAQKEIEKAFTKTAEALELPRDEIEEMGVPSYGLSEVGRLVETVGDYQAEIVVSGTDAALTFQDANGKTLKSVPAKVRKEHADDLKDLRQSLKDIKAILPAQRDRIDSMFLAQRSWPIATWRERYLEHPLVGTIARRLIWCVDGEPASFVEGVATAVDGSQVDHGTTAEITLWHPVGRPVEEVVAWRQRLEEMQLTQPFKQAHREVYLLTAAEENTETYSNRFAAHVVRQHQFNALCSARGWKNHLRLMVDDSYGPPTKYLPLWGLRAEFWVEGIGDEYGADTTESGSYLYLATDQVRFYREHAVENWAHAGGGGYTSGAAGPGQENINEPLPLKDIPPLVFSEIMRDVDLFVGVASVGNDPDWQDGGRHNRYHEYWQSYSFGELSQTAATRKSVLERLIPRLKIAERCSFSDRFLVVRGDVRTYKIHMGSGNILMEPNDEYLCIVPNSSRRDRAGDVYLPFEGDRTLSIILSKALLLAADKKITDRTILAQIKP